MTTAVLTYDVLDDFNTTGIQPADGYSFTYGTETSLNVGFALLPYFGNISTSDGTVSSYQQFVGQFVGPLTGAVTTGNTATFPSDVPLIIPNDVLAMAPGSPDFAAPNLIVTRFTAPSAGVFDLAGSFTDLEMASVGLAIVVNGTTVWNSSFTGSSPYQGTISFSINGLSLAQGATIDFVVDSLGHQSYDVVGLQAAITETLLRPPVMLDAVYNATTKLTKLSGTAEANSSVSIFDNNKLVGTVTAAADGTWSLNATIPGGGKGGVIDHSFTETSVDSFGNKLSSAGVTLFAQAAKQSLQGGSGNDVLIGAPNDTLTGGAGSDTFVFNPGFGKDTITDFNVSQDVLRFDHTLLAQAMASQLISQTHDSSAGAVIVIDPNDTVTLANVTVAQLAANPSAIQFF